MASSFRWTNGRCVSEAETVLQTNFPGPVLVGADSEYDPAEQPVPGGDAIGEGEIVLRFQVADSRRNLPAARDREIAAEGFGEGDGGTLSRVVLDRQVFEPEPLRELARQRLSQRGDGK